MKRCIAALAALALVMIAPQLAGAASTQSDLVKGGTTVAHVSFSSGDNKFAIYDDYPDRQSAAVRYRIGRSTKTMTQWNSGGEGSVSRVAVAAGGLRVKFRACRADRDGAVAFDCAKTWKSLQGSCLKSTWSAVHRYGGACLAVSGQVMHDKVAYAGWAYRLRGQISAPDTGASNARLQVRTHLVGSSWTSPKTMTSVSQGYRKAYDEVVHRGGRVFYASFRVCGKSCAPWSQALRIGQ